MDYVQKGETLYLFVGFIFPHKLISSYRSTYSFQDT